MGELVELGRRFGFSVHIQKPVEEKGIRVSSSTIRSQLSEGNVALVARLLGRFYDLTGKVVTGKKRGSTLGYPTANMCPPSDQVIPLPGIYAAWRS